ncbi:acyl transferase domain-containing protein/phosphopantetheinyl transferase [Actinoalloteichus hoggarensis]|uniref:Phthiocerol/phenolphthiocerol synthesis polyketide synthase type I PpsB n=1 Tax=Actinoalloteichus hoggarensis TaxID=1470176 RepID=A0A221W6A7_9PSEU|nr:type I polyketide synthase [Actinoalloteichus hoggarensis]ASO21480.1 Phthiocerol/phenolphthiocerol synthesis polyketide synthase type I PpsB [Actinoalloteichus hoggarensis]MBB5922069.1 acyl transferase domain-containing protein/phosphopantetheinyl transferase [Actinoalloteichus hoggarensis]
MTFSADGIAIVGMAVLFPQARNLGAYWRNLVDGVDATSRIRLDRWGEDYYDPSAVGQARPDAMYCRRGGFVDDLAEVDVSRFGITPMSVADTEPDQLIVLSVAADAIADAGGEQALPDRDRVGVVLGRGGYVSARQADRSDRITRPGQFTATLRQIFPELDDDAASELRRRFRAAQRPEQAENAIGVVSNLMASRVANRLDLRGPAYIVDGACASSLIAVDQAITELRRHRCDVMLAGGSHHSHHIAFWSVFTQMRALSPTEHIRPFDRRADGTLIGEGTGVVVLKRLADARRDGDRVYAVIRGTGLAGDGRSSSLVSPDSAGQVRAIRQAWREAGIDPRSPDSIGLLEAHGTATPVGDTVEIGTLAEVFGPGTGDPAVIGSVKSMIGHTMPAAGVAGLVKAALAVHHGIALPTLHCDEPHPDLAATRFRPSAEARPWESPGGVPRRAAVNAFGFGGINAHIVLEQEADSAGTAGLLPPARVGSGEPVEPTLRLAAADPAALAGLLAADDAEVLRLGLAAGAAEAGPCRLAIVDPTPRRLAFARRVIAAGRAWRGRNDIWFVPVPLLGPARAGRLAFVFPGLDSESETGFGSEAATSTTHALGILGFGRDLDRLLRSEGVVPDAVGGHSLGEWNALSSAEVTGEDSTALLIDAVGDDSVALLDLTFVLVGAPVAEVRAALRAHPGLVVSHDNSPRQTIVCGRTEDVEPFLAACRDRGLISWALPFRTGAHTPMFAPLAERLRGYVDQARLRPPTVEVWSATLAAPFPADSEQVRELIIRHLLEPVRFTELVEAMYAAGVRAFVQPGVGQVPALIDDILGEREHLAITAAQNGRSTEAQTRRVLAALWADGYAASAVPPTTRPPMTRQATTRQATPEVRALAPMSLALGPEPVSLGDEDRTAVRALLDSAYGGRPPGAGTGEAGETRRRAPLGTTAAAVELSALLGEIERSAEWAASVLDATRTDAAAAATPAVPGSGPPEAVVIGAPQPTSDAAPSVVTSRSVVTGPPVADAAARLTGSPVPSRPSASPRLPSDAAPAGGAPGVASRTAPAVDAAEYPAQASGPTAVVEPIEAAVVNGRPGPEPPVAPVREEPPAAGGLTATLTVSTETMPHLKDHCFFWQRPDWPDERDRLPMLPATGVVAHLVDLVRRARPGRKVVEVSGLRLRRWITAAPPTDARLVATPVDADRYRVEVSGHAEAVVTVADDYPAPTPPMVLPSPAEHEPWHRAEDVYAERLMFHGPIFAKVTEVVAVGERHIRGVLTASDVPGVLLDSAAQLLGYWILRSPAVGSHTLPIGADRIRYHAPFPPPGTLVDCVALVTSIDDEEVVGDLRLTVAGRLIVEITGWRDRVFANDRLMLQVLRMPEHHLLADPRREGWVLLREQWSDLPTRQMVLGGLCCADERAEYLELPPRARRHWLLGRIAAKDAVRHRLRGLGTEGVFPAEIRVCHDSAGRPYAAGVHGRVLPPLSLSLAHSGAVAVALAEPGDVPVGIDVEEVLPRPWSTVELALDATERGLLSDLVGLTGESVDVWFARFWTAKEAAAKAAGTGLAGDPRRFAVRTRPDGDLAVTVGDVAGDRPEDGLDRGADGKGARGTGADGRHQSALRGYRVRTAMIDEPGVDHRPPETGPRYVVAWTVKETT